MHKIKHLSICLTLLHIEMRRIRASKIIEIPKIRESSKSPDFQSVASKSKSISVAKRSRFKKQSQNIVDLGQKRYFSTRCRRNEVENNLDYNILPIESIQEKIDYFISPYNRDKMINKFMNFEEATEKVY